MDEKQNQSTDDNHATSWPPEPYVPEVPRTHWQRWSYLTGYMTGDLILGLIASAVAHLVSWFSFLCVAGLIVSTRPTPNFIWYGSWAFAVGVAVLLIWRFAWRFPALMSSFAIGTVPVAAINLFLLWFGAGLAGGAAN